MDTKFVGREQELSLLDAQWQAPGARFLVLYGRRRVGKTALLVNWIERSGSRALYWVAAPTSATAQLRSFLSGSIRIRQSRRGGWGQLQLHVMGASLA